MEDYREYLERSFAERIERNPSFSLRAYAKTIGLSAHHLSEVLHRKKGISPTRAREIADRLKLDEDSKRRFCLLVERDHARSRFQREAARERLQAAPRPARSPRILDDDAFRAIADWFHLGFVQLLALKNAPTTIADAANRLGLTERQAVQVVNRLKRLRIIRRKSQAGWMATQDLFDSLDGVPSRALREFHRQTIAKAALALESQPVERRYFRSAVLPIRADDLPEAQAMLKRFHDEFVARFDTPSGADAVYSLSFQFFDSLESRSS